MDDRLINIRLKPNPKLIDKSIQSLQAALASKLAWLDNAFGRAYKLVQHEQDGNKFVYPAYYLGNSEYISLNPSDTYGNFCWFDVYDPQGITERSQGYPILSFNCGLVFWFNLKSIYPDDDFIYTEDVKNEILRILTGSGIMAAGTSLSVANIYDRFENIYKGYSIEKIYNSYVYAGEDISTMDKQYFMYPYAGLRFDLIIKTQELCI